MLLFRGEEHVDVWRDLWRQPRGELITLRQLQGLADFWYAPDRRDPAWRRYTAAEGEACFRRLGLTGEFWRLS